MKKRIKRQQGSAAFTIIILLVIAYGFFLGIQYVPIKVESSEMDSILDGLQASQKANPARDAGSVWAKVNNSLYINQATDMKQHFDVYEQSGKVDVTVKYEREINMGFGVRKIQYEKSVTLR